MLSLLGSTANTGVIRANNGTALNHPGSLNNEDGKLVLIFSPSPPPLNITGSGLVITEDKLPPLIVTVDPSGDRNPELEFQTYQGHDFLIERSISPDILGSWEMLFALDDNDDSTVTKVDRSISANTTRAAFYRYRVLDAEAD